MKFISSFRIDPRGILFRSFHEIWYGDYKMHNEVSFFCSHVSNQIYHISRRQEAVVQKKTTRAVV